MTRSCQHSMAHAVFDSSTAAFQWPGSILPAPRKQGGPVPGSGGLLAGTVPGFQEPPKRPTSAQSFDLRISVRIPGTHSQACGLHRATSRQNRPERSKGLAVIALEQLQPSVPSIRSNPLSNSSDRLTSAVSLSPDPSTHLLAPIRFKPPTSRLSARSLLSDAIGSPMLAGSSDADPGRLFKLLAWSTDDVDCSLITSFAWLNTEKTRNRRPTTVAEDNALSKTWIREHSTALVVVDGLDHHFAGNRDC